MHAAIVLPITIHALGAAEFQPVKNEPGLSYKNERVPREPWSIHVLRIDRTQKDLAIYSAHARDRVHGVRVLGVSTLADQARSIPAEVGKGIAVINGDFYLRDNPTYAGDPRGLQIINGELISGPDTYSVCFDADGAPRLNEVKGDFQAIWPDGRKTPIGLNQQRGRSSAVLYTPTYGVSTRAVGGRELVIEKDGDGPWLPLEASQIYRGRVREVRTNGNTRFVPGTMVLSIAQPLLPTVPDLTNGLTLQISTATTPGLQGVKAAIGGGPALLQGGKATFTLKHAPPGSSGDWSQRSKYERHPRAAIGWNATNIFLIVVDGRQPRLSEGMKLAELSEFLLGLGCTDGMNLDGGKSAQIWMNGQMLNSPCQGEDTVANSLVVMRRTPTAK